MSKKKRSAGSVILSFLSGLVSLILILVLAVSVAFNIAFYNKDKPFEVNINLPFYRNHSVYFINNSGDLQEIEKGSLVTVDPELPASKSFYVLCTIGNNYKTILAVTDMEANANGTVSYTVRGTKPSSTITHTIPQYKIDGVVKNQNQQLGDFVAFATDIKGAVALMAIPAFLLIILCISAIKRNKSRYEDELVESEILIEELRKMKKGEEKKKKTAAAPAPALSAEEKMPEPSDPQPSAPAAENAGAEKFADEFEEEMNRKALAIKNAMNKQIETPSSASDEKETEKSVSDQNAEKPEFKEPEFQSYESIKEKFTLKNDADEVQKEFNAQMAQLAEKQQQITAVPEVSRQPETKIPEFTMPSDPVPSAPAGRPVFKPVASEPVVSAVTEKPAAPQFTEPSVQAAPAAHTAVKKKKRAVASIKADSFDDLIKMLDNEKSKL